jgi:hypothetical protein
MTYGTGSRSACQGAAEQDDPGWLAIGCPSDGQQSHGEDGYAVARCGDAGQCGGGRAGVADHRDAGLGVQQVTDAEPDDLAFAGQEDADLRARCLRSGGRVLG